MFFLEVNGKTVQTNGILCSVLIGLEDGLSSGNYFDQKGRGTSNSDITLLTLHFLQRGCHYSLIYTPSWRWSQIVTCKPQFTCQCFFPFPYKSRTKKVTYLDIKGALLLQLTRIVCDRKNNLFIAYAGPKKGCKISSQRLSKWVTEARRP